MSPLDRRSAPLRTAALSLIVLALMLAVAALAGCGGGKAPASESGTSTTPAPETPAPAATTTDTAHAAAPAPGAVASDASGDLGERVFKTRCVICHGPTGHGDGVASKALDPKPRNFHDKAHMSAMTDAQLLATIHTGKGAMPRWQGQLSEAEMKAVLGYIRKFAQTP